MRNLILGLILVTAGAAEAQAPNAPMRSPPPAPDTTVSGVTVVVHRATPIAGVTVTANVCPEPDPARYASDPLPVIVDSYPAQGGVVAPGSLVLRATFAAPMSCYWEIISETEGDDDPCQAAGRWALPARTSWTMDCRLKPNAHYTLRFGKADGQGFVGRSGRAAPSYVLSFYTSDAPPISMEEARRLSVDGVKEQTGSAYVACSAKPDVTGADCVRMSGPL